MSALAVRPSVDTFFDFKNRHTSPASTCHLRIYTRKAGGAALSSPVVIVSAIAENEGMSICNAVEDLAPQIAERHNINLSKVHYFEYWGPFSYEKKSPIEALDAPRFSRVLWDHMPLVDHPMAPSAGTIVGPKWRPVEKQQIEKIIGAALAPWPFE